MNSLLPSPTLIDLSLRCDLYLIIVLQVTASVSESFVEIGVWGGEKKKKKDLISGKMGREAPVYVHVGCVCQSSQQRECSMQWKLQLGIE